MTNENEYVDETTQNNEEDVVEVEETETEEQTESPEEVIARLEKENHTLKIQKGKIKAKAERATEAPKPEKTELSQMDIVAIVKADVHEEDMNSVTKFAQMEGISIRDALANDDMQAILERRAETRKVAQASNTSSSKGSNGSRDGQSILDSAKAGNMPDTGDLTKMWEAQIKKK